MDVATISLNKYGFNGCREYFIVHGRTKLEKKQKVTHPQINKSLQKFVKIRDRKQDDHLKTTVCFAYIIIKTSNLRIIS